MMTSLSDRMKEYEKVTRTSLMRKTPIIIRIDGKAFHTWTRHLKRPFDTAFYCAMADTANSLLKEIQGAVLAYGQSDEISILVRDYDEVNTEVWFNGAVQKIVSVAASLATGYFAKHCQDYGIAGNGIAFFDARVFNVPQHEVVNYFIWRQQDFMRNSVQMMARHYLGHAACQNTNREAMIQKLKATGRNWDNLPTVYRLGYTCTRTGGIDFRPPEFTKDRGYVNQHVYLE
jgi:tRNA(His) 5'-end guanylyltransferase